MIRKDFVKRKLSLIQDELVHLLTLSKFSLDEIVQDFVKQAAVERILERVINRAIDVNNHIVAESAGGEVSPPKDYTETFLALAQLGVYSEEFARSVSRSVGTRNVLVHEYDKVDEKKIYSSMGDCLRDYHQYIEHLLKFLKQDAQKGFSSLVIVLVALGLLVIGVGGYYFLQQDRVVKECTTEEDCVLAYVDEGCSCDFADRGYQCVTQAYSDRLARKRAIRPSILCETCEMWPPLVLFYCACEGGSCSKTSRCSSDADCAGLEGRYQCVESECRLPAVISSEISIPYSGVDADVLGVVQAGSAIDAGDFASDEPTSGDTSVLPVRVTVPARSDAWLVGGTHGIEWEFAEGELDSSEEVSFWLRYADEGEPLWRWWYGEDGVPPIAAAGPPGPPGIPGLPFADFPNVTLPVAKLSYGHVSVDVPDVIRGESFDEEVVVEIRDSRERIIGISERFFIGRPGEGEPSVSVSASVAAGPLPIGSYYRVEWNTFNVPDPVSSWEVQGYLLAGSKIHSETFSFPVTGDPGTVNWRVPSFPESDIYKFRICLERQGRRDERYPGTYCGETKWGFRIARATSLKPQPDLAFDGGITFASEDGVFSKSGLFAGSVSIINKGDARTGDFVVSFQGGGGLEGEEKVQSLDPGERITVPFSYDLSSIPVDKYAVLVALDPGGTIGDFLDTNNIGFWLYEVVE
jgi:uncharacterized protein YutE (UPF0331/DUF86 family)